MSTAQLDGQASGRAATGLRSKSALTRLLNDSPREADLYVQDEAELSLLPTLTRMWMLRCQQRNIRVLGVRPPVRATPAAPVGAQLFARVFADGIALERLA